MLNETRRVFCPRSPGHSSESLLVRAFLRGDGESGSRWRSSLGHPPAPSRPVKLLERLAELPSSAVLLGCLSLVALVGLADCATGQDLSLSIFYLIPTMVAATKGCRLGLVVAATAAAVGLLADIAARITPYSSAGVPLWNSSMRFTVLVVVVILVDALLDSARHERQLARRDHLTGLENSRAFSEAAGIEFRGLVRRGRPLTLACVDIDRFKTVNDRHGHAAGDAVLVETARVLALSMREVDTVARIGGDEFMVLLHETDSAEAQVALDRVHSRLVNAAAEHGWDVGCSVGVATFTSPPASIGAMVAQADRVMYEVKQSEKRTIRYSSS